MKRFKYRAVDSQGKSVSGEVEAVSDDLAAKLVRRRGYVLVNLSKTRGGFFLLTSLRSRVSAGDVTAFTRQMSTMINAGLPIVEALSILRMQSKPNLQSVFSQILADVEGGESLSGAMKRHTRVFSPTYIALIKAGEAGGVLDKVLARLADNLERQQEFKGKVRGALIYPAVVVTGMLVVSTIMVIFVIPKMTTLYEQFEADLPLPTKILMGFSDMVLKLWPILLVLVVAGVWGFSLYRKTAKGKRKIAELIFKIPLIGELQKEIVLTELTRTLSLMVGSGVPILEGLAVTSAVISNVIVSEALDDVSNQIEKGFPIAFSFAKHPEAFPYILSQMIAVGEETGKMEEVLSKVSHVFEVDSDQKVKALTAAIEPIVMIVLGIGVAFLVIAVILPIYNLTTVI